MFVVLSIIEKKGFLNSSVHILSVFFTRKHLVLFCACLLGLALLVAGPRARAAGLPIDGQRVSLTTIQGAAPADFEVTVIGGVTDGVSLASALRDARAQSGSRVVYVLGATPDVLTKALGEVASGVDNFTPTAQTQYVISYVVLQNGEAKVGSLAVVGDVSGKLSAAPTVGQVLDTINNLTESLNADLSLPSDKQGHTLTDNIASQSLPGGESPSEASLAYGDSPTGGHYNSIGYSARQYVYFQNFSEPGWIDGKLELSDYAYIVHFDGWDDRDFWTVKWIQELIPGVALPSPNPVHSYRLQTKYTRVYYSGLVDRSINSPTPATCPTADWGSAHVIIGWPVVTYGNIDYYYGYNGYITNLSSTPTYAQWNHVYNPGSSQGSGYHQTNPGLNEVVPQNQKFAVDLSGDAEFLRLYGGGYRTYNLPGWRFTWTKPSPLP